MADNNSDPSFLDNVRGVSEMTLNQIKNDYTQVMQNKADREAIVAREANSNALTLSQKEQLSYISNAEDAQKFVEASVLGNENGDYNTGQDIYKESLKSSGKAWGSVAVNAAELYAGGALAKGAAGAASRAPKLFGSIFKSSTEALGSKIPSLKKWSNIFKNDADRAAEARTAELARREAAREARYAEIRANQTRSRTNNQANSTANQARNNNPFANQTQQPRESIRSQAPIEQPKTNKTSIFDSPISKFLAGATAWGTVGAELFGNRKEILGWGENKAGEIIDDTSFPNEIKEFGKKTIGEWVHGEGNEEGDNDEERGSNLLEKAGAGAFGAAVAGGMNPFKGIKALVSGVGSLFPSKSSSEATLSSMPSGGDLGTTGEGHFEEGGMAGNTVLDALNKIFRVLSTTKNITEDIAKNISMLTRSQTQQDASRDLMSSNLIARQNESGSTIISGGNDSYDSDSSENSSSNRSANVSKGVLEKISSYASSVGTFAKKWKFPLAVAGGVAASLYSGKANASEDKNSELYKTLTPVKGKLSSEGKQGSLNTKEFNERIVYAKNFFIQSGWTEEQASGIVGNLIGESGLQTAPKPGDGGTSYGIAQWHSPERQQKFKEIIGVEIKDASFGQQLQFVDWELKNTEKNAGKLLKSQKTVSGSTGIFEKYYERDAQSAGPNGKISTLRIKSAERVMNSKSSPIEESNNESMTPEEIEHRRRGANIDEIKETPEEKEEREKAWSKYDEQETQSLVPNDNDPNKKVSFNTNKASTLNAEVQEVDIQKAALQEERAKLARLSPRDEKDMAMQLDRLSDINTEIVALNQRRNAVTGNPEFLSNSQNKPQEGMQQASLQQPPSMSQQLQGPKSPAGVSKVIPKVRNDDPTIMRMEQGNLWSTSTHAA